MEELVRFGLGDLPNVGPTRPSKHKKQLRQPIFQLTVRPGHASAQADLVPRVPYYSCGPSNLQWSERRLFTALRRNKMHIKVTKLPSLTTFEVMEKLKLAQQKVV